MKPVSAKVNLDVQQPEEFRGDGSTTFSTHDPLMKAALLHLGESWPLSVAFDELLAAALARLGESAKAGLADSVQQLPGRLLHCYTSNLVEFSQSKPKFVSRLSARPIASPYARLRARTGGKVINFLLETVSLGEPSRLLLSLLDGTRDHAELAGLMKAWLEQKGSTADAAERSAQFVEQALQGFARSALLLG
jgi:hypothetical protein